MNLNKLCMSKTAIITGAASGIGAGIARFSDNGVRSLSPTYQSLPQVEKEINDAGNEAHFMKCNVIKRPTVRLSPMRSLKFGRALISLSTAPVLHAVTQLETLEADWDFGYQCNSQSVFLMSKHVIPHMKRPAAAGCQYRFRLGS